MIDVHVHLPAGAQKRDGPRSGVGMIRRPLFRVGWC
jgi:ATP-dependent Lon protease